MHGPRVGCVACRCVLVSCHATSERSSCRALLGYGNSSRPTLSTPPVRKCHRQWVLNRWALQSSRPNVLLQLDAMVVRRYLPTRSEHSLPIAAPTRSTGRCRVDGASSPDLFPDQVRQVRFESPTRMIVIPKSRLFGEGAGLELTWDRLG
jgi:hypothetical protein